MPTPRTADTLLRTANRDQRQRLQPAYDAASRRLQRTWETRQRGYIGALKALQAVAREPNASRESVRTSREYADFKGEFAAAGKQYMSTVRSAAVELESDGRKNGATAAYNAIAATEKPKRVDVGDIARYTAEAAFALSMAQFVSGLIDGIDSKWQQADQRGYSPAWVVKEMRAWADSVPVAAAVNVARTAQLFGARRITLGVYKGNGVKQWIWSASLDGKVCAYCVSMHGTVHDINEQMSTHHSCRCAEIPVTPSWSDLGFTDGEDFKVQRGDEWLRAQPYTVWERILGKAGAAAYKDGAFALPDVSGVYTDDVFGVMGRKKSLEEILGKQIADAYKRRIA